MDSTLEARINRRGKRVGVFGSDGSTGSSGSNGSSSSRSRIPLLPMTVTPPMVCNTESNYDKYCKNDKPLTENQCRLKRLARIFNARNAGRVGCVYVAIIVLCSAVTSIYRRQQSSSARTASMMMISHSTSQNKAQFDDNIIDVDVSSFCFTAPKSDEYLSNLGLDHDQDDAQNDSTKQQQHQRQLDQLVYSQQQQHTPIQYRHDGHDRFAPLPKRTRWIPDDVTVEDSTSNNSTTSKSNNNNKKKKRKWSWPPKMVSSSSSNSNTGNSNKDDKTQQQQQPDLWWVRGVAYDLNEFVYQHPGGYRYILNAVNTDITELFEAHHIGLTAVKTLRKYRYDAVAVEDHDNDDEDYVIIDDTPVTKEVPQSLSYKGHTSARFHELKVAIRQQMDLNYLKEPAFEYTVLFWCTVIAHILLYWACFGYTSDDENDDGDNSNDETAVKKVTAVVAASSPTTSHNKRLGQQLLLKLNINFVNINPWILHLCLALTGVWLGGFAHNGLHMWSRRKTESLVMYFLAANNPFRWMHKHIIGHHIHTNTAFDTDKTCVWDFQKWVGTAPYMIPIAVGLGTFLVGLHRSAGQKETDIVSMTTFEQKVPTVMLTLILLVGIKCQGFKKFVLRYLFTLSIMSMYSFTLFQVSHYQPQTLDGDNIHATVDDWGDFQLRTTWGWNLMDGPLLNMFWLNLNLQPSHHMFPAVHHSKLRFITPLIRQYYPGLMDDHSVTSMAVEMFKILLGQECIQEMSWRD